MVKKEGSVFNIAVTVPEKNGGSSNLKFNINTHRWFYKCWALLLASNILAMMIAIWTTNQIVLVSKIGVEFNPYNIPKWALFGFIPSSFGYLEEILASFIGILIVYRLMPNPKSPTLAIFLIILLLGLSTQVWFDGIGDLNYYLLIQSGHYTHEFNYSSLTGCYYEHVGSALILYLNQSYYNYSGQKDVVTLNQPPIALNKCLRFN